MTIWPFGGLWWVRKVNVLGDDLGQGAGLRFWTRRTARVLGERGVLGEGYHIWVVLGWGLFWWGDLERFLWRGLFFRWFWKSCSLWWLFGWGQLCFSFMERMRLHFYWGWGRLGTKFFFQWVSSLFLFFKSLLVSISSSCSLSVIFSSFFCFFFF